MAIKMIINVGDKYGKSTVIREIEPRKFSSSRGVKRVVECLCDCGKIFSVMIGSLRSGNTISCGCVHKSILTKHGKSGTKIYEKWRSMKRRCELITDKYYFRYGGRGIKVCDEWQSFSTFYKDMGECPDGMSIERVDNNRGYSKENCRWATRKEQQRNMRSNNLFTYRGKTQCLTAWAEEFRMDYEWLRGRTRHGWTIKKALETPKLHLNYNLSVESCF